MQKVKNIDKYFEVDPKNKTMIFIGNNLKVLIPKFYEERGLLTIEHKIKTLGILRMQFDSQYETTLIMITTLILTPIISITTLVDDDEEYYVLEFNKGDMFLENTVIIKNPNLLYTIFMTFIALGKIPKFLKYNDLSTIFDNDSLLCGVNLGVNHKIYEMIFSHMSRDKKDPFKFYRLTDKKDTPMIIPMHSIAFGPQSATAKMIGSYFGDALTSSMVAPHDKDANYDLENLLRA